MKPSRDRRSEPINHWVITRHCCRGMRQGLPDPLRPENLEHRLRMIRVASLASLRAQTCKDFKWLVLVDKDLPASHRGELERLLDPLGFAELREIREGNFRRTFLSFDWLEPCVAGSSAPFLTTFLDDDDAVCTDFVASIQADARRPAASGVDGKVIFYGAFDAEQWDFFWSPRAPLGYRKPWTRRLKAGQRFPVSAGFSVYCASPKIRLAATMFWHNAIEAICDRKTDWTVRAPKLSKHLDRYRGWVEDAMSEAGFTLSSPEDFDAVQFRPLGPLFDGRVPVVMTNHLGNNQLARMFERPALRRPVRRSEGFPGVAVDLDYAAEVTPRYQRSIRRAGSAVWAQLRTPRKSGAPETFTDRLRRRSSTARSAARVARGMWELR